jgi:hypothetical protein
MAFIIPQKTEVFINVFNHITVNLIKQTYNGIQHSVYATSEAFCCKLQCSVIIKLQDTEALLTYSIQCIRKLSKFGDKTVIPTVLESYIII